MPTTVQLSDETHAKLLELAARRGGWRVAALVEEAVARYLAEEDERRRRSDRARAVLGTLAEEDASAVEASIEALRDRYQGLVPCGFGSRRGVAVGKAYGQHGYAYNVGERSGGYSS